MVLLPTVHFAVQISSECEVAGSHFGEKGVAVSLDAAEVQPEALRWDQQLAYEMQWLTGICTC